MSKADSNLAQPKIFLILPKAAADQLDLGQETELTFPDPESMHPLLRELGALVLPNGDYLSRDGFLLLQRLYGGFIRASEIDVKAICEALHVSRRRLLILPVGARRQPSHTQEGSRKEAAE
jgi:hypothetical protein